MATSSAQNEGRVQLMPGSFDAQDYVDIHDDPFEVLAQLQEAWRKREPPAPWSANNLPGELDGESVWWYAHEAPAALTRTPGVTDDVLLGVVQSAIDNITAVAAEENQRRAVEEEQQRGEETEETYVRKPLGTDDEPYLPIIIIDESATKQSESDSTEPLGIQPDSDLVEALVGARNSADGLSLIGSASDESSARRADAVRAVRHGLDKARALGLRKRLFNRGGDKSNKTDSAPESSSFDLWRRRLAEAHDHAKQHAKSATQVLGKTDAADSIDELVYVFPRPLATHSYLANLNTSECVSCLDEFPARQLVKVPCHSYCTDCFASLISTACQNEQQWPPKCCLTEIPFRTILKYAPENLQQQFKERSSEWNTPAGERVYCSHAGCSLWIRPEYINPALRQGRCTSGHWTCTLCHGPEHGSGECPQDRDMTLTNQLAEEEGWKRCFNCKALVEHKEACQHMTCRCGTQFCYVCSRKWRTCTCTMDQLAAVKSAAQARRAEREAKELADSEELRQMLAEIEEFEREESLKAEMLRQEQIRLEEERQQRELEERVRREKTRRQEVEDRFAGLRVTLGQLHELQRVMIRADQEKAVESLGEEARAAKEQLEIRQSNDMEELAASIQTKLHEKETAFNQDFSTRAAAEKKIMDEYHRKLIGYYHNKPRGAEEVGKAMLPLQQKMENSYRAWQGWKKQEMAAYRDMLEEERTIKGELVHSTKQRLAEKHKTMEASLADKGAAEKQWFRLVVLEREKLLGELELQEMEGDADSLFAVEGSVSGAGDESRSASRASSSHGPSSSGNNMTLVKGDDPGEGSRPRVMPDDSSLTENPWIGTTVTTDGQQVSKPPRMTFQWGGAVAFVGGGSNSRASSSKTLGTTAIGMAY